MGVFTHHPNFSKFVKLPLKFGHGWLIASHCFIYNIYILARAKELIANGLGESTPVMNAMRTPFRQGKPGIVKIQFSNTDDKIRVLRAKMKLAENSDYKKVFIRSSQSHADRLLHNNTMTILQAMGVEQKFRFTGSGRLVPRQEMTPKVPDGAPSVTNLVTYNGTQRTYPPQNTHQMTPPFHGGMYPASQGWVTTPNNYFPQNLQGGNSGPVTGHPSIFEPVSPPPPSNLVPSVGQQNQLMTSTSHVPANTSNTPGHSLPNNQQPTNAPS